MSHAEDDKNELEPTFAPGYKITDKKTVDEYAKLDANDDSLNRWKASLGIGGGVGDPNAPKVVIESLYLSSPTLPPGKTIDFKLDQPDQIARIKEHTVTIKEGVEYSVGMKFRVNREVITGLRYLQVAKRAGVKVDSIDQVIGSFAPKAEQQSTTFLTEESPSGMLARSGKYTVRSKIVDDDKNVHADFEWCFKLGKDW